MSDYPLRGQGSESLVDEIAPRRSNPQGREIDRLKSMIKRIAAEEVAGSVAPAVEVVQRESRSANVQAAERNALADRALTPGYKTTEFIAALAACALVALMFAATLFADLDEAVRANYLNQIMELAKWAIGTLGAYIIGRPFVKKGVLEGIGAKVGRSA